MWQILPHQLSVALMFALNSISLYCKGLSLTYRLVIVRLLFVALNYMNGQMMHYSIQTTVFLDFLFIVV